MQKPWYTYLYVRSPISKIVWGIVGVIVAIVVILFQGIIEEPRMVAQTASWEGRGIETGAELYLNNCEACHGANGEGGAGPALNSHYFFTERLNDIDYPGTLQDYVALTIAAGRPSKSNGQWPVMMPTWSARYGGPMRDDEVQNVVAYVMNWETSALAQSPEEDPWISFRDTPSDTGPLGISPDAEPAEEPVEGEPREPQQIFTDLGCSACHNLDEPQTDANRGPVGPNMGNLHENAPERVPGEDAVTYVHNSIVDPNHYIVPGYQPVMPALADRMTEEELDNLVEWLLDPERAQ